MLFDKIIKALTSMIQEKERQYVIDGIFAAIFAAIFVGIAAGIVIAITNGTFSVMTVGVFTAIFAAIFASIFVGVFASIFAAIFASMIIVIITGITDFILLSSSLLSSSSSILVIIGILFVLSEILFIYDKKKPEGQSHFKFTAKRKSVAWFESFIFLFILIGIRQKLLEGFPQLKDFLRQYNLLSMSMMVWTAIIILMIYLYIYINSLKYKKVK